MLSFEIFKRRFRIVVEDYLRLENILYAFWTMFWTLNGLDKFFNGTPIQGNSGPAVGWFGVNRDPKFIDYFSRLGLPSELALTCLYGFAVLEVVVGLTFLAVLLRPNISRTVHRLAFKVSMLIFLAFSTGDILFGDRAELWEHGTFMVLTLMTYQLYLGRTVEHADVVGEHFAAIDQDKDRRINEAEYATFLAQRRLSVLAMEKKLDEEEGKP